VEGGGRGVFSAFFVIVYFYDILVSLKNKNKWFRALCCLSHGTTYISPCLLPYMIGTGKGKGKVHPRTGHEGPEGEYWYSSLLSLTSAPDRVGGQSHALAPLPPGKTRYPLYRRPGGPQDQSGRVRKISPQRDSISGPSSL
jgi:hypothetical protein